ncbi:MAG: hypothetical protein ACTSW2_02210 [Alphaproteobacteria bacterium]
MSEQADADELMRQYLDLWQDQMSALAADQDFARAMQQVMTGMGLAGNAPPAAWAGLMAGLAPAMQGDATADAQGREAQDDKSARTGHAGAAKTTSGTSASRAASSGGGADVDKLTRRLAALEKRIAALEGGPAPSRRRAASKPRKPRS